MKSLGKLIILVAAVLVVRGKHLRLAPLARIAGETEFPHQVSIQLYGRHYCGGALISTRHVLTAGHCVRGFILDPTPASIKAQRLVVEVGSIFIGSGTKHAVKRVSQIREFKGDIKTDPLFMPNDIAVITLRTPVTESAKVKPIGLPGAGSQIPEGTEVTISGFGSAQVGTPTSDVLQTSPMTVTSREECNRYYTITFQKAILASHVCAKRTQGHGTCKGDSGGPLIQGNTVVGVVSGGNGICGHGDPDVYTKVSHFLPYIKYEMNYDSNTPNGGAGPSLAVDIDETSAQLPPPGQVNPFPTLPGGIQFLDPNTGAMLPAESVVWLDPATGLPIVPVTPQFPQIPLYPIYPVGAFYPISG